MSAEPVEAPEGIPVDQWRRWTPQAQAAALAALEQARNTAYRPFYCPRGASPDGCDGLPHGEWAWNHARTDQHPPKGPWLTWLLRGGRGSGKTRTGSEWTHKIVKVAPFVTLVSPTAADARDTVVEGESGILATAPPGMRPEWEPSKRRLTWPNGARGTTYSGEEPDRLRGQNASAAWLDEPAHMPAIDDVWSNLTLGLRKGDRPRIVCTTTPLPIPWIKDLSKASTTINTVVPTQANLHNLSPVFAAEVVAKLEGTRRGRQELHGEIIEDVEGALWNIDLIDPYRYDEVPHLDRIVVAVDPAGTARVRSDETGIVVVGVVGEHVYVLHDASGKYSPKGWADKVLALYATYSADAIVAEQAYGADLVVRNLTASVPSGTLLPKIDKPSTRRGKKLRAEPVVHHYERGMVHHSRTGSLNTLEDQMFTWVPTEGDSPDRVDALVHGITAIAKVTPPSRFAIPKSASRLVSLPGRTIWS